MRFLLLIALAGCTSIPEQQDAGLLDADPCTPVQASYGAAAADSQHVEARENYLGLVGVLDRNPGVNELPEVFSLELKSASITTGTFTLDGDELDYRTCDVCVALFADYVDGEPRAGMYLATAGTVTITDVTGRLAGNVSDVTFAHVTLDDDLASSPAMDQCVTTMTSLTFDAEITD